MLHVRLVLTKNASLYQNIPGGVNDKVIHGKFHILEVGFNLFLKNKKINY